MLEQITPWILRYRLGDCTDYVLDVSRQGSKAKRAKIPRQTELYEGQICIQVEVWPSFVKTAHNAESRCNTR